jgi:hypothetical protein
VSEPLVRRARRLAQKRPSYVAWRLTSEARHRAHRRRLAAARAGRGGLTLERIVPAGLDAALAPTASAAGSMGSWTDAIRVTRGRPSLRREVERRVHLAEHRVVPLFGEEPMRVGIPPLWSHDPRNGLGWPEAFHRSIDYVNHGRPSDVKYAWELSRLRHCVALAQGCAVLDDSAALIALSEDIRDWITRNPVGFSVNWTVGMEVALRALNLICVDGILSSAGKSQDGRDRMVASLYQHGWFLDRNREISDLNGNHYLACALGLVWLGRYFGPIGEAPRWYRRGVTMVEHAAGQQILSDGLDHEGSLPYHLLVLEMFLLSLVVARSDLAAVEPAVEAMLEAAERVVAPTGECPDLGDDDGGRVAAFSEAPSRDARRVLALGAALFCKPLAVPQAGAWPEDALWLAGTVEVPEAVRSASPVHLDKGGLVVLGRDKDHVVVDVGPVGFRGRGGHGHLDAMSFVAWLGGTKVVRDSGTGSYTGDPALRNLLRDVPAHTTVILDECRYAKLGGIERLWSVDGDFPPRLLSLAEDTSGQWMTARQELPCAAGRGMFERSLRWAPGLLTWTDVIDAPAGTLIRQFTQLPRGARRGPGGFEGDGMRYRVRYPDAATVESKTISCSGRYGSVSDAPRAEVALVSSGERCVIEWVVSRE